MERSLLDFDWNCSSLSGELARDSMRTLMVIRKVKLRSNLAAD